MNIKSIVKTGIGFVDQNSPAILTGTGVAGLVSTAILASKGTIKAKEILNETKDEIKDTELTFGYVKDVLAKTWKCYIPAVSTGIISIICIIGSHSIHNRRYAALASLYALSENKLADYKLALEDKLKPKQLAEVNEKIAENKMEECPFDEDKIILTGKGEYLCFDAFSGRYFKSDIETIRRVVNDINQEVLKSDFVTLNDFYFSLGLEGIKYGDEMGWSIDDMLDPHYEHKGSPTGEPCLSIDYSVLPKFWDNRKYY